MPWLTAPGCWILSGLILAVVGLALAVSSFRKERAAAPVGAGPAGSADSVTAAGTRRIGWPVFMAIVVLLLIACLTANGPTAAWRHRPVGAGRVAIFPSMEQVRFQFNFRRDATIWEAEGVESSVGILDDDGYSFFVNGKSDGNVIGDRGTQILCGLIGAALHPSPRTSLVVGLGTGCTAGWLSEVRTMERVDVVELEPAIIHMADLCTDANVSVMDKVRNGKAVRLIFNDAREVLNTTPDRYDVIASEPSNPYRAGIASLFTREFYEEVRSRLNPGGLFVSWCQAYEIDTETVFRILATLKTVFPHVECWNSQMADLVFIASMETKLPDPALLARRLKTAPFPDAMRIGWSMSGLEGFLSRFIATDAFIDQIVASKDLGINTDDLMKVEYDYARTVGRVTRFSMTDLRQSAVKRGQGTPEWQPDSVDTEMTAMSRALCYIVEGMAPNVGSDFPAALRDRLQAVEHWRAGNYAAALQIPFNPVRPPHRLERLARAECLAWNGDDAALQQIPGFEDWWPASAAFVRARLAVFSRDWETATTELERGYAILRERPWELKVALDQSFKIAQLVAQQDVRYGERLLRALGDRFKLSLANLTRKQTLFNIAVNLSPDHLETVIVREFEPNPLWNRIFLEKRLDGYEQTGNPLAAQARKDLDIFNAGLRQSVEEILSEGEVEDAPDAGAASGTE
ncbi:MAG: fused MFS/spermidine synthase [Planctomycetes bacterium]|nr:fused MFS/spermidine synthase [Planctomycetota bacterium]